MQLNVTGKQVDIGNALRGHVEVELESILTKYFKTAIEAHVVIAKDAHLIRAEVSLHISRGIVVNASGALHDDGFGAFDAAAERIAKQLRCKRRLRDHHAQPREPSAPIESARDYLFAPIADEELDEHQPTGVPTVIAEISTELPRLTVSEAVMRMDLADVPVVLVRNQAHGGLNLVDRRTDGNIGWVDPVLDPARRRQQRPAPQMADSG